MLSFVSDGLPIVMTANIDGYIPLKFETGKTYSMSCDGVTQGARSDSFNNQSSSIKSPETHQTTEHQLFNGLPSVSTSREFDYADVSKAASPPSTKAKTSSAESKAERLKAMIQNDKSGNALRRLQAAAGREPSSYSSSVSSSLELLPGEEPVKPPRRGAAGNKNNKSGRSDDGGSFMDVTAAL